MTSSHGRSNNSPGTPQGRRRQTRIGKINMKLQNLIQMLIGIVCIGLLPGAQAVVPAPDGGYPGGNTAEGQNALLSLTSGIYNTAVGFSSLKSNTIGNVNTAIGVNALSLNTTGVKIRPTAVMHSIATRRETRTRPAEYTPSLATPPAD